MVPLAPASASSTCVVTGASAGIGADIARELARRGWGVTLVARREERLKGLAEELVSAYGVPAEVVAADLAADSGRQSMIDVIAERDLTVEVLVNNAGFGSAHDIAHTDRDVELAMVRTNVEAVADLCYVYVPEMVKRGRGAILNVASTAAFQPLPGMATYSATKAFVLRFTEALHEELRSTGVTATALCPGPVRTEFLDVATAGDARSVRTPSFVWMSSEATAKAAVDGMFAGRRVVVPGLLNQVGALAGAHWPRRVLLPLVRRFNPFPSE